MNAAASHQYATCFGNLMLVNADHPIRFTMPEKTLMPVGAANGSVLLERDACTLLESLMEEISGWDSIVAVSGWRSQKEQQKIWDDTIKEHGLTFAKQYVALPGCSEHQTGLAIDLGLKQDNIDFLRPNFPCTGICRTFREQAAQYGFIQRYLPGKEMITGIAHEPWHFRYVGVPHASIMTQMDFTLEEYHDFIKQYPVGEKPFSHATQGKTFEIMYGTSEAAKEIHDVESGYLCAVSGDNMEGFVLTTWKG